MCFIKKLMKDKRGQAMVELAMVLPILVVLVFGIMEFGRAFHDYVLITNASREGARVGSTVASNQFSLTQSNRTIMDRVEAVASTLGITDSQIIISYTLPSITTPDPNPPNSDDSVSVKVDYHYAFITPGVMSMLPSGLSLSSTTAMKVE